MCRLISFERVCMVLLIAALMTAGGCAAMNNSNIAGNDFGKTSDGRTAKIYTLVNAHGMTAVLTDYGATLTELHVPDADGNFADVVLGFDNVGQYETDSPYFGCTVGRVANRIAGGRFTLDGEEYQLATNNPPNHLHGGAVGFNKRFWEAHPMQTAAGPAVRFEYFSPDGEEGYPGNLGATVTYTLTDDNVLRIVYEAQADAATPVNLTHHSYFNLAGHGSGDILGHVLHLRAANYTPADETFIPTGEIAPVAGQPVDFTKPHAIGERIGEMQDTSGGPGGYDLNYVLDSQDGSLAQAAVVLEPASGRIMAVYTDQPGIQFYTGNFLDGSITGKDGVTYDKHEGFCLETQIYPDAINQPKFPSVVLQPGEMYRHVCEYRFATE